MRHRLALAGLLAALAAGAAAQPRPAAAPDWPADRWNPPDQARPDDVVLSLPCGGRMTFRPVVTDPAKSGDALADLEVRLGRDAKPEEAQTGYVEFRRTEHLLGSLGDGSGPWRYLIAKYETTADQWDAVMGERCAQPAAAGRLPRTGLSWFDAVDYSRRLTEWLLRERPGALPRIGQETAYLRLPTEAEWEFAARGGGVVDEVQFRADDFFGGEGPERFAVFNEGRGPGSRLREVGVRQPNPAGLYDMLGNAAEFVLDAFRANSAGRLHGQVGAVVFRGGSFRDGPETLRSSWREEKPAFVLQGPGAGRAFAADSVGFRLVVAAPVFTSDARVRALQAAFLAQAQGAPAGDADRAAPGREVGATLAALRGLTAQRRALDADNQQLRTRISEIERRVADLDHAVRQERDQRDAAQARLSRAVLLNGALLVRGLRQDARLAEGFARELEAERALRDAARREGDRERVARAEARLPAAEERAAEAALRQRESLRAFANAVAPLAEEMPAGDQRAGRDRLAAELGQSGLGSLVPLLLRFDETVTAYRERRAATPEALLALAARNPLPAK